MNIGFIGVGGVAQPHLQNLIKLNDVKISAVCDIQEDRVNKAAETYGAKAYSDYKKMIRKSGVDAVYVCVIPGAHGKIELDLAKAGIPFYAEKPIHLDLKACQRVLDALAAKSTINAVGYHWRYTKASKAAHDFCRSKKVSLVEGAWYGGMPGVPWWRQMATSGGQFVEQSTHIVDMARYLAGEVSEVYAIGSRGAMSDVENYDIHDTSVVTLKFDSGAVGQITSGCIAEKHGGDKVDITAKGRDWFAWTNAGTAKLSDTNGLKEVDSGQSWAEQLGNGDAAFVDAVRTGDSSRLLSPYVSGVQTLAITLMANKSMETGKVVKVPRFV